MSDWRSKPDAPVKLKTAAVHAGQGPLAAKAKPVVAPVHLSSVSYFDSADDLDASIDGFDYVYTRIAGQNAALLEEAMAALEGAPACVAFASGMAALRAVLAAQNFAPGDRLAIAADGYSATRTLGAQLARERGASIHPILFAEPGAAAEVAALRPKLVLAESLTNPLLSVPDLAALAAASREVGAALAVDATFASPALQRPYALGADYVIQSTTKWLNGHSDAVGGTVSGAPERIEALRAARVLHGSILGPFEAWLTLRGLRTLPVRMRAHGEHAFAVAQRLEASPMLERIRYPGLPSHPHHAVARQMFSGGFGGMLAFHIRGAGRREAFRFLESVRLAKPAPSLGDVGTLVMHAASASARRMTPAEREAAGIGENLIRVSVGLEDPEDVAADVLAAVERAMDSAT